MADEKPGQSPRRTSEPSGGRPEGPGPGETSPHKTGDETERYVYWGRTIEIRSAGALEEGHEPGGPAAPRHQTLIIDGEEIDVEVDENGVLAHDFMFKRFSTVYELAEELIRQWGTSIPNRSGGNGGHNLNH